MDQVILFCGRKLEKLFKNVFNLYQYKSSVKSVRLLYFHNQLKLNLILRIQRISNFVEQNDVDPFTQSKN